MATDQEIRDAGFKYIPQQKYLLNPFEIPTTDDSGDGGGGGGGGGIPFTDAGNNFSVYNPDPNSIANKNYDPYRYRNAIENSFLYGGSNATDPKYLNQSFDPSGKIANAQKKYNEFQTAPYRMGIDTPVGQRQAKYESDLNEMIMDNQERYRTQGQYETVPSEFAYSSQTELDKFKDNYPEYFASTPLKGIPGAIQKYAKNSFLGKGFGVAKDFLNNILPINKRAILENELSGQGVMVDDIGRIVQGEGAYNTGQNIMAGYNAGMIDADTIQGRLDTINESLGKFDKYDPNSPQFDVDKYNQMKDKIAALNEFAEINDIANIKTDSIIDSEEEEDKKKKKNIIERLFLNTKKKKTTDTTTDDTTDGTTTDGTTTGGMYTGDPTGNFANIDNSGKNYGPYSNNNSSSASGGDPYGGGPGGVQSGMPSSSPTNVGNPFGYMDGGRVYFFDGGRVNFKNGGLASIL